VISVPKINPSPKTRFLGIKHCVDSHKELLQRPDLITSLEQAMLEYTWLLCGADRPGTLQVQAGDAAASYYKILGAHEFIRTFRQLAEVQTLPPMSADEQRIKHDFK